MNKAKVIAFPLKKHAPEPNPDLPGFPIMLAVILGIVALFGMAALGGGRILGVW